MCHPLFVQKVCTFAWESWGAGSSGISLEALQSPWTMFRCEIISLSIIDCSFGSCRCRRQSMTKIAPSLTQKRDDVPVSTDYGRISKVASPIIRLLYVLLKNFSFMNSIALCMGICKPLFDILHGHILTFCYFVDKSGGDASKNFASDLFFGDLLLHSTAFVISLLSSSESKTPNPIRPRDPSSSLHVFVSCEFLALQQIPFLPFSDPVL